MSRPDRARSRSLNPLFIGERLSTPDDFRVLVQLGLRLNPLFIGERLSTCPRHDATV